MSCEACTAFEARERAAIQGITAVPVTPISVERDCTCVDDRISVLHCDPASFSRKPQIGSPMLVHWHELAVALMSPMRGERKDIAGAWSPVRYAGNVRRKSAIEAIYALLFDIDMEGECAPEPLADALSRYRGFVHESFSSTLEQPRSRLVLVTDRPIDLATHDGAHKIIRARLAEAGFGVAMSVRDATRLSYWPARQPGAHYRFRILDGAPLNAAAIVAAQPPKTPPPPPKLIAPKHTDAYSRGALVRAAEAVAKASDGERHFSLSKEAFCLARLDIADHEIASALLPPFIARAGHARGHEGARTIRDAIAARRK